MVRHKVLPTYLQLSALKSMYGGVGSVNHEQMIWQSQITPTAISDTYCVQVKYKIGFRPHVYIKSPNPLPLAQGAKRLPHIWDEKKQEICLFRPEYQEWTGTMLMAKTLMHWAIQWLVYYESWLYTGVWQGGGHGNPDVPKNET